MREIDVGSNCTHSLLMAHFQGGGVDKGLAELEPRAKVMLDDLLWWTEALKAARSRGV